MKIAQAPLVFVPSESLRRFGERSRPPLISWLRVIAVLAAFVGVSLIVSGCGGVKFKRQVGAVRYRALPLGTPVKMVEEGAALSQPIATIGTLSVSLEGDALPSREDAEELLVKHAARYGCDVVVGAQVKTRKTVTKKKDRKMGPDGKTRWIVSEKIHHYHDWIARCVRTSAAPGGLRPGAQPEPEPVSKGAPVSVSNKLETAGSSKESLQPSVQSSPAADRVWHRLVQYKKGYLRQWSAALEGPTPQAAEVLDCLHELMVQVTGPGGFWRRTVPQEWFGCGRDPSTDQCRRLEKASRKFVPFERLRSHISRLGPSSARAFLQRSEERIFFYLDTYVPLVPNLSGMKQTPFYRKRLEPDDLKGH